ncbi:MAG: 3-deoxy-D-manno-octulosonic acid transferase [Deltaproteobacteria bacterium]|nr:3-deoxy-D-manno-octulosonic acid transferase [Deltaproteobacteria bacterium]
MAYFLYNFIVTAVFIACLPLLPLLYLLGKRFHEGLAERFGFYDRGKIISVAGKSPVWIHAASVGEVRAASHLVRELKQRSPARKIIVSTFTATGNRIAREMAFADLVLFLPLDVLWIVRRTYARIDPSVLIIVETEIWPNLLREAYRRGVPTLLLSGRLSARSLRRYSLLATFFRRVIQYFTALGMQSEEDHDRIVKLGAAAERVSVVGNLKHAARDGRAAGSSSKRLQTEREADRRGGHWLVVGSSHRGEEAILIEAFITLKRHFPHLQMVLAPRHPQRFAEVERLLKTAGLPFEKKSQVNGRIDFQADVMLVDTIGDLQDFYAAGDVAFVGGSLVDGGGHNLLEPARFAKPVLFGPYMTNFKSLAREMTAKGGGIEVKETEELIREVTILLTDSEKRKSMGKKAYEVAADDRGVVERSLALAARYLSATGR